MYIISQNFGFLTKNNLYVILKKWKCNLSGEPGDELEKSTTTCHALIIKI